MTQRRRTDGCGAVPDGNDWIVDCAIQLGFRTPLGLFSANVST